MKTIGKLIEELEDLAEESPLGMETPVVMADESDPYAELMEEDEEVEEGYTVVIS